MARATDQMKRVQIILIIWQVIVAVLRTGVISSPVVPRAPSAGYVFDFKVTVSADRPSPDSRAIEFAPVL
jgi:hypothetical protein